MKFRDRASLIIALVLLACGAPWFASTVLADAQTITRDLSSAAGVKWEFKPEGEDWRAIQVPAGGWRAQGYTCDAGIYRATLGIPREANGRLVQVAFAAVNFGAEVFAGLDAEHLVHVASHLNGWMPFSADVTGLGVPGSNLVLVVEVKGRRKYMVNGRYAVPEGAPWYDGLAEGILRGIELRLLPPIHIQDAFVRTELSPPRLHPQIAVTNGAQGAVTATISGRLSSWNRARFRYPEIPAATLFLRPGETRVVDLGQIAWKLGPRSYWWPNVPYRPEYRAQLHFLDLELKVNGEAAHVYRQRFGFRTFAAAGNHFELNGVRCNLRGDNQQEANFRTDAYGIRPGFGPPTAANPGWPRAVDNLLRLNFNTMRIHQIPATPYMLDVCDEQGLMIVAESPVRGSEGKEDFVAGRQTMLNMDRELVLRDRHHPSVVVWSAANEWADPIPEAVQVMRAVDDTRPIIADGGSFFAPLSDRDVIVMDHYVDGLGSLPLSGGILKSDRPYGETEAVWFMDHTWQGFAWMATSVRVRRVKGNSDLRNYVLNNAWPNYVPGEGPETLVLEARIKNMGPQQGIHAALTDPWNHPLIRLMQQCYHPVAVCDALFDLMNAGSNEAGEWPVTKPRLPAGTRITRELVVFNDEFKGDQVAVRWEVRRHSKTGPVHARGQFRRQVPLGECRSESIAFETPREPGDIVLLLSSWKSGEERFSEDQLVFSVVTGFSGLIPDGDYRLISRRSKMAVETAGAVASAGVRVVQMPLTNAPSQVWRLRNLGGDHVLLIQKQTGLALGVQAGSADNGAHLAFGTADERPEQVWHVKVAGDNHYFLVNKANGNLLNVAHNSDQPGAPIHQWYFSDRDNQRWKFVAAD